MEESHESFQNHVGQSNHSRDFPPFYHEQAKQTSAPSAPRFIYPYSVATIEQGPVEIFRQPNDEQIYERLEYAPEFSRQRLVYTPLTPPLTPQNLQASRGHHPACHTACSENVLVPRRESWPLSHPPPTAQLCVRTSPPPYHDQFVYPRRPYDDLVGEDKVVQGFVMEKRRDTEKFPSDSREDMKPIPLQDPPKSKFKRQLSEDSTEHRTRTSFDAKSVPPASPVYTVPRTPQPESAQKEFAFNIHDTPSGTMSPKRVKTDCGPPGFAPSSSFPSQAFSFTEDLSGNRSPKRVKGDNGSARPPMSPLVQGDRHANYWASVTQTRNGSSFRDGECFFQFPDVKEQRGYEETQRVVYVPVPDSRIMFQDRCAYPQEGCKERNPSLGQALSPEGYPSLIPQSHIRKSPQRSHVQEKLSPEKSHWSRYQCNETYFNQIYARCTRHADERQLCPMCDHLQKRQPIRSQSNIDHSPSKKELEEAEKEKYLRSLSKPEGPRDLQRLQRQKLVTGNLSNVHESPPLRDGSLPGPCASWTLDWSPWQQERRGACRQLFGMRETEPPPPSCNSKPTGPEQQEAVSDRRYATLIRSYDDCDILIVPSYSQRPDTMTSFPDPEAETLYMQQRRQTISTSRNISRSYSPTKGRQSPGKKRQSAEVNVRLNCLDVAKDEKEFAQKIQSQQTSMSCTCERVQAEILEIAKTAYSKSKRDDPTPEAFERSQREIRETNRMLREALDVAKALKELCGHNTKINDVYSGSVVIAMQCSTLASLENLREKYRTGELKDFLYKNVVTDRLREKYGVGYVLISVTIDEEDFERCRKQLEAYVLETSIQDKKTVQVSKVSPLKRETKSVENLENIPSCPESPVHMRSSLSTPVLMTSSPLSSPSFSTKSPSTPTKRDRIFSFSNVDQSRKGKGRSPRERKFSLTTPGDLSPRRVFQPLYTEEAPSSPSKKNFTIVENEAYRQQSSPRLRKSLEDITSDMANVSVQL